MPSSAFYRFIRFYLASFLALGLLIAMPLAWAQVDVTSPKDPFVLTIMTQHNSKTARAGEPFEATLSETYCFETHCVPEGTVFKGIIAKTHRSRRFHRPGYLAIKFQSAVFPDGETVQLGDDHSRKFDLVYHHRNPETWRNTVIEEVPYVTLGTAIPIFLQRTAHWGPKRLILADYGVSAVLGVIQELLYPTFDRSSIPKRIGYGLLSATAIPDLVALLTKRPEATLAPGEKLKIRLPADEAKSLYLHSALAQSSQVDRPAALNSQTEPKLNSPVPLENMSIVLPLLPQSPDPENRASDLLDFMKMDPVFGTDEDETLNQIYPIILEKSSLGHLHQVPGSPMMADDILMKAYSRDMKQALVHLKFSGQPKPLEKKFKRPPLWKA